MFSAGISSEEEVRCHSHENIIIVDENEVVNDVDENEVVNDGDDPNEAVPMAHQANANASEEVGVELEKGERMAITQLFYAEALAVD